MEPQHTGALVLDLQPPDLGERSICLSPQSVVLLELPSAQTLVQSTTRAHLEFNAESTPMFQKSA